MIGFLIAILIFNTVAFSTNRRLTINQIVHIWLFTISLQTLVDVYVDIKYHGYWYFKKGIDWLAIPTIIFIVPPVNMMFLNWFPLEKSLRQRILYFSAWYFSILFYETLTLLPEPWGYFHYGWWNLGYSALVDPFLLVTLLYFYKWVCRWEKMAVNNQEM